MKPKLPYLSAAFAFLFMFSCVSDDGGTIPDDNNNHFTFNGVSYELMTAIITDENTTNNEPSEISISLFNKTSAEVTGNGDLDDVSFVYFEIVDANIQNTTYDQIDDYDVSINGAFVDNDFNPGTILLSDSDPEADVYAQSGSVTVTNFTPYNIVFTFTFTRNDGQVITGSYDGNYYMPN